MRDDRPLRRPRFLAPIFPSAACVVFVGHPRIFTFLSVFQRQEMPRKDHSSFGLMMSVQVYAELFRFGLAAKHRPRYTLAKPPVTQVRRHSPSTTPMLIIL